MYYYNIFNQVFAANRQLPISLCAISTPESVSCKIIFLSSEHIFERYEHSKKQIGRSLYRVEIGYVIAKGKLRFLVDKLTRYILIYCSDDDENVILYLLGEVLSLFFRLRNRYQMHACMLSKNDTTIVLCGSSGNGKSTLANVFFSKGWRMLCDDHSIVYEKDNFFWGVPSFPYLKIFLDEINPQRHVTCLKMNDVNKGLVSIEGIDTKDTYKKDYRITCVFFLNFDRNNEIVIDSHKLDCEKAFKMLIESSYGSLRSNGDTHLLFNDIGYLSMLRRLSESIPGYQLSFSKRDSPEQVAKYIEKIVEVI